jgi:hypothetical protein
MELSPCREALVSQLVKKFVIFYWTFFTRACHLSMSGARWIQPTSFHPVCIRSILISFHLKVFQVAYSSVHLLPHQRPVLICLFSIYAKFLAYFTAVDLFTKGFLTMKHLGGNRKSKFPQDTLLYAARFTFLCVLNIIGFVKEGY